MMGPAQRDEHVVALGHPGTGASLAPLQPDPQICGQAQRGMGVGVFPGAGDGLAVRVGRILPDGADAVVVECRLAAHHQLDRAAHAAHRAQQDVFGVPVHRRAAMRAGSAIDVVPRSHHQRVAHDQPPGVGLPGGLHDQAARQVPAGRGHRDAVRADAGNGPRCGPRSRRTRWASPAGARTTTPPSRPARSGRSSPSRTRTRSRRSAGTGFAALHWRHTARAR